MVGDGTPSPALFSEEIRSMKYRQVRGIKKRRRTEDGLSFYESQTKVRLGRLREFLQWIIITVIAVVLAVLLTLGLGKRLPMLGESMESTLSNGQNVLINRVSYHLGNVSRYDVIAFYPGGNTDSHPYVKRVVGMPGDTVQIENGALLINGVPDVKNPEYDVIADGGIAATPVVVGENEYFVIGDNRNASEDSRAATIGNVSKDSIIGKVWYALPAKGANAGFIK